MKHFIFILLFIFFTPAYAVDLFGIQLLDASRAKLGNALNNSGIKVITEAGDDAFYDVYNSEQLLPDSTRLYLGFVKHNGKFAFAEYEFNGLQQRNMLQKLNKKYGKARKTSGKFLTDTAWIWQVDAITITLKTDWRAYKTRLTYQNPAALQQLRLEQRAYQAKVKQQQDNDTEMAY